MEKNTHGKDNTYFEQDTKPSINREEITMDTNTCTKNEKYLKDNVFQDIRIEVWGPFACFTRPELKTERVSYEVMTPSAARNILQKIYWHPGVNYKITAIEVIKPIEFMQMKRNELKSKIIPANVLKTIKNQNPLYLDSENDIMQRSSLILKNVHYVIHAQIYITPEKLESADDYKELDLKYRKTTALLHKNAKKGRCIQQPFFGIKEYPCNFRWIDKDEKTYPTPLTKDLGTMLYDMNYKNPQKITPIFFHATIKNGIMDLRNVRLWEEVSPDEIVTAPPDIETERNNNPGERKYKK